MRQLKFNHCTPLDLLTHTQHEMEIFHFSLSAVVHAKDEQTRRRSIRRKVFVSCRAMSEQEGFEAVNR